MKKALSLFLCLVATISLLATGVSAAKAPKTKEEKLIASARSSYTKSLSAAGKSSFHGYCGLMTSCQLKALGINKYRITNDGNKQFDYYSQLTETTGGYSITPYYAEDYSLEEALNEISRYGTRDVYNILVCFERTNTESGKRWGHAVLINGIIDGRVYFVESYDSSVEKLCREGEVITCSIARFAEFFASWTTYEGSIYFGDGSDAGNSSEYGTDVTVMTRFDAVLRSKPTVVGNENCIALRTVPAGQRFWAVALLENDDGDLYYRVALNDGYGYLSANAVTVVRVNPEDISLWEPRIPQLVPDGQTAQFRGAVMAKYGDLSAVEAVLTDFEGNVIFSQTVETTGYRWDLSHLNTLLPLQELTPGTYLLELYGHINAPVHKGQQIVTMAGEVRLVRQPIQLGGNIRVGKAYPQGQKQVAQTMDGWVFLNDSWYYYQDGAALTGWFTHYGNRYYLGDTGAAATGNVNVDGKELLFSQTGALITGFVTDSEGTHYRDGDGVMLTGWQTIDGDLYYFMKDGIMVTNKRLKKDGKLYTIDHTGKATR